MGDRRAHLVGSIPAVTAAKAMRLAVERLGPELDYVPDGETGDRRISALAQGAPEGSRFGLHLCLGDMNHRALGRLPDASPLVLLANAVAARWPDGRPLHYVHAPLAAADNPPPVREAFYRPLAGLKLGPDIRFIAGFAHEDQDAAAQFRIRQMIEDAVGHPVDVSTSCGLGRREPDAAKAAMDRIKLLLSDGPPAGLD